MTTTYNDRHKHERDDMLCFDEIEHRYSCGGRELESVTTIVENCFEKFDAEYWADRKARQLGRTTQEILDEWEAKACQARDLGTLMHDKIEKYYLGIESDSDDTFDLFLRFALDYELCPYRTEWRIFYEEYGIAGTLDFLECRDGRFVIYDWKRSTKLINNGVVERSSRFGKKALSPIKHIDDSTFYHYALQVSIYRYILEKKYDIVVSEGHLAVFHPDNKRYYLIDIPYLRDEVEAILAYRQGC